MTTTTYYDLNIVEGTDIVNPLTVDNPNYERIDEVMHNNSVSGVTLATEIANATVHAITRENSECAVIRFIATSEWKSGDTVTVDGVPVTALLPSGETLPDGAYVINANVLCILTGTNLTVYAERKKIDSAAEISYGNTNVAAAITKLNSDLSVLTTGFTSSDTNINLLNNAYVSKYGKLVIIECNIRYSTVSNVATLITDHIFPKPVSQLIYSASGETSKTDAAPLTVRVSSDGKLSGYYGTAGVVYAIRIVYFTNE